VRTSSRSHVERDREAICVRFIKRRGWTELSCEEASISRMEAPGTTLRLSSGQSEWVQAQDTERRDPPRFDRPQTARFTKVRKAADGRLIDA
jgi:hypothetical protein